MDTIKIRVSKQWDCVVFWFALRDVREILAAFPDAQPSEKILLEAGLKITDNKDILKTVLPKLKYKLEHYIFPALSGLNEHDLTKIKEIQFFEPISDEIYYQINTKNNVEKEQPVFG
jgi:Ni,Fe-hydrogenase III component G